MTTLKLIYTQDNQAIPTDTLDLLCFTGNVGFQIANNGWQPIIGRGKTQEALTIHAKGDDQDEVIDYLNTVLKRWKNYVLWSQDYTQEHSVWLQAQWENETNIRQARILSFDFQISASPFGEFWQNANFTEATITFERLEWEQGPSYPSSIFIPGGQSVIAGNLALPSGIVPGDVNGRILQMQMTGNATFKAGTVWAAFRRNLHGDPSLFVPLWQCETAFIKSADTTISADATASNGSRLTTTFSPATLERKFFVFLEDITSNYNEQRGKFLVLYRAMCSDASTVANVRVAFGTGGLSGNNFTTLARVQVSTPFPLIKTWSLYELGVVSIPSERIPRFSPTVNNALLTRYFIGLDAERVSGSGNLYSDCFILLPVDEAFLKTDNQAVPLDSGNNWLTFQNELNDVAGYVGTTTTANAGLEVEQRSWGIPPNISQTKMNLIITGDGDDVGVNSVLGDVQIVYIPRWTLARGNE